MSCNCHIIPDDVLKRLAGDEKISAKRRKAFSDTVLVGVELRKLREQASALTAVTRSLAMVPTAVPRKPAITVGDCKHAQTLPGIPIGSPKTSKDATVKRAAVETQAVAAFYNTIFKRNSVDNAGMTLGSSVHYGANFNNAFWNGSRMVYGDGDGKIFIDFTGSTDVIAHELTHGVTQYSLQLNYQDESGGLNESISDVFGSMFRQWRAKQDVARADWLIGKDIMGPDAKKANYTCLRDMAQPGATHCLAPQPSQYSQYKPGMDPHYSSGIPNLAFYRIATALGGNSWDKAGQIWYKALTGFGPTPGMGMKDFADRTRQLAQTLYKGGSVFSAVNGGWKAVGL